MQCIQRKIYIIWCIILILFTNHLIFMYLRAFACSFSSSLLSPIRIYTFIFLFICLFVFLNLDRTIIQTIDSWAHLVRRKKLSMMFKGEYSLKTENEVSSFSQLLPCNKTVSWEHYSAKLIWVRKHRVIIVLLMCANFANLFPLIGSNQSSCSCSCSSSSSCCSSIF